MWRHPQTSLAVAPSRLAVGMRRRWEGRGPLRRWRRRKRGLCLHCGYNLTGNTSGVCPECAQKIEGDKA